MTGCPVLPRDGRPRPAADASPDDGGGSPHQFGERDVKDLRDAEQGRGLRLFAGLDALEGPPADPGCEVELLLGEVPFEAELADAVTDVLEVVADPGVVVGQVWHPLNALVIKPGCLPNVLGILRSSSVWGRVRRAYAKVRRLRARCRLWMQPCGVVEDLPEGYR